MKQPTIIFIINGTTYSLCASDTEAIRNIPSSDRQHLITLLEQVKIQEKLSVAVVQQQIDKGKFYTRDAKRVPEAGTQPDHKTNKPERLGSGDIDAVMAQLVVEEKRSRKPALTKLGMYKVIGWFAAFIVFLVLIL